MTTIPLGPIGPSPAVRAAAVSRGRLLNRLTIGWKAVEGVVAEVRIELVLDAPERVVTDCPLEHDVAVGVEPVEGGARVRGEHAASMRSRLRGAQRGVGTPVISLARRSASRASWTRRATRSAAGATSWISCADCPANGKRS